jgi:hypothetical protein
VPVKRSSVTQKMFQIVGVERITDIYADMCVMLKSVIVVASFAET